MVELIGFTLIRNHKVLKRVLEHEFTATKFYTYKKSQGSQTKQFPSISLCLFYTYKKSQGSQTIDSATMFLLSFYTYKKSQGSQTGR